MGGGVSRALLVCVLWGVLSACGLSAGGAPGDETSQASASDVGESPALADVAPLDDVRDWEGEVTAYADTPVDPVAEDPEPELPVTVTDAQGTKVTVEDTSRVLAL